MTVDEFIETVADIPHAKIFHGAQLRDFETYVRLGSVAPRSNLFERDADDYTPFGSDVDDHERMECGGDFFGNLLDQGKYSRWGNGLPNVYGPINLVFPPSALGDSGAKDVTVRRGAIWSSDEAAREILDAEQIRGLYNKDGFAKSGEIQVHSGSLHIADLAYVVVSPIAVGEQALVDRVRQLLKGVTGSNGYPIRVYERGFAEDGRDVYERLVTWAADAPTHGGTFDSLPEDLQARFGHLGDWKYSNFPRFAEYLSHGTLSRLAGRNGHLAPNVTFEADYEEPVYDDEADLLEQITSLNTDQLNERDDALSLVERAEFRLQQAQLHEYEDEDEQTAHIDNMWQEYIEAVEMLNQWIVDTRRSIIAGRDEMIERILGSHDGEMSVDLTVWADEFDEVDIPYLNSVASQTELLDWKKVLEYRESAR
jgi:hypothetical protein